jgi:hypothetical protein
MRYQHTIPLTLDGRPQKVQMNRRVHLRAVATVLERRKRRKKRAKYDPGIQEVEAQRASTAT